MSKKYYLKFGSADPATNTGLSPTFTIFAWNGVTLLTPPGITESPSGSGLYGFEYGPTVSILFKVDGGAALSTQDRFISSALDPIQAVDEKVGTENDSFGSTVNPTTIFGYNKRLVAFNEGNANFNKSTAIWTVYGKGSSTILMEKSLTNTTSAAGKT